MTSVEKIKRNDVMMIVHYFKVRTNATMSYTDGRGKELSGMDLDRKFNFDILGRELIESAYSADQYNKEENSTKTVVAEKLIGAGHLPFTVCFIKQDGSERVLRGRLIAPETLLGRSMVEDLDEPNEKKRLKQVDHRTIKWLILDDIKHVVK